MNYSDLANKLLLTLYSALYSWHLAKGEAHHLLPFKLVLIKSGDYSFQGFKNYQFCCSCLLCCWATHGHRHKPLFEAQQNPHPDEWWQTSESVGSMRGNWGALYLMPAHQLTAEVRDDETEVILFCVNCWLIIWLACDLDTFASTPRVKQLWNAPYLHSNVLPATRFHLKLVSSHAYLFSTLILGWRAYYAASTLLEAAL